MIKKCKCENAYMDKKYGQGVRVHTVGKGGVERCVVCGPPSHNELRRRAMIASWKPEFSLPPTQKRS